MEEENKKLKLKKATFIQSLLSFTLFVDILFYFGRFFDFLIWIIVMIILFVITILPHSLNRWISKLEKDKEAEFYDKALGTMAINFVFSAFPGVFGGIWYFSILYLFFVCIPIQIIGLSICCRKILKINFFKS